MLSKKIIDRMNILGAEKTPFLFIIDFDCTNPLIFTLDEVPDGILYKINNKTNFIPKENSKQLDFDSIPSNFEDYETSFNKVINEIDFGNSYLLNLCGKTEVNTNYSLMEIFHAAKAKYKLYFDYNQQKFTVFSPEIFIQIRKNKIYAHPMKGTIDASLHNAKQLLIDNPKEQAEHYTIVDLLRNDLSMVSKNVTVKQYRYLENLKTNKKNLLQTSSKIVGDLPENFHSHIGDILDQLLPAGSISGAPKSKTTEIIHDVELDNRGYYTGIMGYFDGERLDAGIMIRYIEQIGEKYYYRSGGGITSSSKCKEEYEELNHKIYVPIN